jgi:hypothetical protein
MELEKEHSRGIQVIEKMNSRVNQLQAHVHDFTLQSMQETQVNLLSCTAHQGLLMVQVHATLEPMRPLFTQTATGWYCSCVPRLGSVS